MEKRAGFYHLRLVDDSRQSIGYGVVEIVERLEVAVDERLINKGPEMLSRLEFGAVWRLVNEMDAIGDGQVFGSMPSGHCRVAARSAWTRPPRPKRPKSAYDKFEQWLADRVGNVHTVRAGPGLDEPGDVYRTRLRLASSLKASR